MEEAKKELLGFCKIIDTYTWSDDRQAYDVPKYVLSDSKTIKLINKIFDDHEAQLKAKDEEIHYLKTQLTGWSMLFDESQDAKDNQ